LLVKIEKPPKSFRNRGLLTSDKGISSYIK
jgi:hypothetical protein